MIICPKCGHDNELGRIFCSGCSEKLDLSQIQGPESIKKGKGGFFSRKGGEGKKLTAGKLIWRIINYGGMLAIVVIGFLLWQEPEYKDIKGTNDDFESASDKLSQLRDASIADDKLSAPIELSEKEIAMYLSKKIKFESSEAGFNFTPSRVMAELQPSEVTVVIIWTMNIQSYKHPFVVKIVGNLKSAAGKLQFEPTAISVGKCPIPKFLQEFVSNKQSMLLDLKDDTGKSQFREIITAAGKQGKVTVSSGNIRIEPAE